MYFVISQICVIAVSLPVVLSFSKVPSIDDQVAPLGSDVFCLFTYGSWVMKSEMVNDVPSAVYFANARLPYHRLDFNYYSEELNGNLPTIVPDNGYEVWGALYFVPVQDLDTVLERGGIVEDNVELFNFTQKIAQVYYGKKFYNIKCNAFQQTNLPEKLIYGLALPQDRRPSQQVLDMLVEAYQDSGLPAKYIEEVSMLPTIEEGMIETNLIPTTKPTPQTANDNQQDSSEEEA